MYITCGYGTYTYDTRIKWASDCYKRILENLPPRMYSDFINDLNQTNTARKEHGQNPLTEQEYIRYYCNGYSNTKYGWYGDDGLITDLINEKEFPNQSPVFVCRHNAIYVELEMPEDECNKPMMMTKKRIREILTEHLWPLTSSGLVFQEITCSID